MKVPKSTVRSGCLGWGGPLGVLLMLGCLWGCGDQLECGPGTHQEGTFCVSSIPLTCNSPFVELRDGRCQPKNGACGEGRLFDADEGTCVDDPDFEGEPDPRPDPGEPNPGEPEMGEPDMPVLPMCGEQSSAGTVCLSGLTLDWSQNTPIDPRPEALVLLLDDLVLRIVSPTKDPFATAVVGLAGDFLMEDVPINSDDGPLDTMILIASPLPGTENPMWHRTLTGIPLAVEDRATYQEQSVFVVPTALVTRWNALLERTGEEVIGGPQQGFLLLRVLVQEEGELRPVPGATVRNIDAQQDDLYERYYLADDYLSFREDATTGATGAVLLVGPTGAGNFVAEAPGFVFAANQGGTSPGVGVVSVIVGVVE